MLGCAVNLQLAGKTKRFFRRKGLIQGSDGMGVQIIHDQDNLGRFRVLFIQQPLDLLGPVFASPVLLSVSITPSIERFREQKDAGSSIPNVLVVLVFDPAIL